MGSTESKSGFPVKKHSIIRDYKIKEEYIGKGLRGNILTCYSKTGDKDQKYALKLLTYKV